MPTSNTTIATSSGELKTYISPDNNFSFNYPADWEFESSNYQSFLKQSPISKAIATNKKGLTFYKAHSRPTAQPNEPAPAVNLGALTLLNFDYGTDPVLTNMDIPSYFDGFNRSEQSNRKVTYTDKILGDLQVKEMKFNKCDARSDDILCTGISFKNKDSIYFFSVITAAGDVNAMNQIVASFTFTK